MTPATLPALLQTFFTDHLNGQRRASKHTVAGYRDSFRLLLRFASQRLRKPPSALNLDEIDSSLIGHFLQDLEVGRGNAIRTRNTRLAAIHSFFRYVAANEPAHALLCQRVLALPSKRYERKLIDFLEQEEVAALLAAPNAATWTGRRNHALILVAAQTGLRVSELIGLRCEHVALGTGAHVRCTGKGRKERCTPLRKDVVTALRSWLRERRGDPSDPLFPTREGRPLTRDAIERFLAKYAAAARDHCPSLARKRVSAHVLRHTAAMELLRNGVDLTVIALWLGHESPETTLMYLHADLRLKEKALARTAPYGTKPGRFQPDDSLLAFLEAL